MSNNPDLDFRVQPLLRVVEQVRVLTEQAKEAGEFPAVTDLMTWIGISLQSYPEVWGDPTYRTKREGGIVYRGIRQPLVVHYAVFAKEKIVFVLDIMRLDTN